MIDSREHGDPVDLTPYVWPTLKQLLTPEERDGKLSGMETALLKAVCDAYPHAIRKADVLEQTRYASSGPISSAFAKLVGLGYVVSQGPSLLKASEELFG